jgi:putative intracellular protease/amidase
MTAIRSPENAPVLEWLREHGRGQTLLFSWCAGAEVLAESGLIDGQTVTTHWGDINAYERSYPAVTWQRGVRYIDAGTLVTTGGITAGVDATLHLLARLNGQRVADTVAHALHYPASPFVTNPQMPQYTLSLVDSPILLNLAYSWPKPHTGVWLYDGVGEADLAAVVEAYQLSSTERTLTTSAGPGVVSQHGLQLVPRVHGTHRLAMDRIVVPGGVGADVAATHLRAELVGTGTRLTLLQNDQAPTYAFTLALEDLAATHDVPTAVHTARQLEVRSPLHLVGSRWPLHLLIIPLLAGLAGCVALWSLARLSRRAVGFRRAQRLARAVPPPLRST